MSVKAKMRGMILSSVAIVMITVSAAKKLPTVTMAIGSGLGKELKALPAYNGSSKKIFSAGYFYYPSFSAGGKPSMAANRCTLSANYTAIAPCLGPEELARVSVMVDYNGLSSIKFIAFVNPLIQCSTGDSLSPKVNYKTILLNITAVKKTCQIKVTAT